MNSLHRTRRSSNVLLAAITMLLFVRMEVPLWGMIRSGKPAERSDRTPDRNSQSVAVTTEQNRRNVQGAEDDGPSELGSPDRSGFIDSDACTSNKRNPRRQSSQIKSSIARPPLQQQLTTELTSDRKQIEEETATSRTRLAQSLFEKHPSLQEEQNALEDFSDREKVYQGIEALHATQEEALKGIRTAQQQLTQERFSPKGCFSLFYSSNEKFIAREKVLHQKLFILSQEKVSSYPLELEWLLSFSKKRNALLGYSSRSSSTGNHEQQVAVERALQEAQEVGRSFIEDFCRSLPDNIASSTLDALSDEQLHCINAVIDLVRNTQLFILGHDSSSYITMSKEQLAEIEESLAEKIKKLDPSPTDHLDSEEVRIDPIIKERYLAAQDLLEHNKAQFLLMETTPEGETIKAASKSSLAIHEKTQETEKEITGSLESELTEIETKDTSQLTAEIRKMKELHDHLLNAMLSYREIQDEAWIEKQCGNLHHLSSKILEKISAMEERIVEFDIAKLKNIVSSSAFPMNPPLHEPQSPVDFLENLMSLHENLHAERVIGINGKIALDHLFPNDTKPYSDQTRREWASGINLIRQAICMSYSIEVMKDFDQQFWKKIQMRNSLKVKEIIDFLFNHNQQPKYRSSFFVDPKMSHEDFLQMLSAAEADNRALFDKVIKIDQATLNFNPFSKKPLNLPDEELATAILRQREAGFQYVRETLKKAFPEAFLTNEQMNEVLHKFDEAFQVTSKAPLLTLEKARTFIENERTALRARSCYGKYVARYLNQESFINMRNGICYSIGMHLVPFALGILSYLYYLSLTHTVT
ncbi:MAG: hypothetical protein NT164_04090 [Verrucomicrobiae bacterium]|nr:hypothetical protein [Verrucomicrobiae bacterium]